VLGLADSVVGGLLGSKGGTFLDGVGQESNILNSSGELFLGGGQKALGVGNGLEALSFRGGVGVSLVGGGGDLILAHNSVLIVFGISGGLLGLGIGDELVHKGNNVINNTFGSEVNL